jgi:hypothetical protein
MVEPYNGEIIDPNKLSNPDYRQLIAKHVVTHPSREQTSSILKRISREVESIPTGKSGKISRDEARKDFNY